MDKKQVSIILILAVLVAGAAALLVWNRPTSVTPPSGGEDRVVKTFEECIDAGYPVMESYPAQCRTPEGQIFVENIGNELEKTDLIRVSNPRPNETITSPLRVEGEARGYWYFEASFPVRILDDNGITIAEGPAQADGDWMTEEFVPFVATLEFKAEPTTKFGVLILQKDNPSGLPEHADELRMPVVFGASEITALQVYFGNAERQTGPIVECGVTYPVRRTVPKTAAVARAAIDELLKGPTADEVTDGYSTSLNTGVGINSLTIENGVATVDFNSQLEDSVGGSCRVEAIRAQIEDTLRQFRTVTDVVISIDGRVEDILQP